MKNKPAYSIASVDSALLLATVLQHEGPVRVTDAAERLGVSVSTAHRLLGMLVYRDFAEQLPDRRYGPGPLLHHSDLPQATVARLRAVGVGQLQRLVDDLGETANLMVLTGVDVRFVATVECGQVLRVGDRTGRTLPAHRSSGGKALLAAAPRDVVDRVLAALAAPTAARLRRELTSVRPRGFALNQEETEAGLTALGAAVPTPAGMVPTAISVAMPSARWSRELLPTWSVRVTAAAAAIAHDLGRA